MWSIIYGILLAILISQDNLRFSVNAIECLHLTWTGSNDTIHKCNGTLLDFNGKPQPCKVPFNTTKDGKPPNLKELAQNKSYRCFSRNEQCMSYSWFDINGYLQNYSKFCGKVIDVSKPSEDGGTPVRNSCWEEKVSTFTRKVCVCDYEDYCNGSASLSVSVLVVAITVSFTSLVGLVHSPGDMQ